MCTDYAGWLIMNSWYNSEQQEEGTIPMMSSFSILPSRADPAALKPWGKS